MQCCLGLGGNLGHVGEAFARSISELQDLGHRIEAVSSMYRTTPMGANAGNVYQNAALIMQASGTLHELLDDCQRIESTLGRERGVRWGPRNVDLDLLLVDDLIIRDERLQVPHPGCAYRRFVLDPLVEIAPAWRHPVAGMTVEELRTVLMPRPLVVAFEGSDQQLASLQALLQDFITSGCLRIGRDAPAPLTLRWTAAGRFSLRLPSQADPLVIDPSDTPELLAVFTAMLDEPQNAGAIPGIDATR